MTHSDRTRMAGRRAIRWTLQPWAGLDRDTLYAWLRLRAEVFVVEQACAYADADGADPEASHLLGWEGEALIAGARLFAPGVQRAEAVIGRVVTAPTLRGLGLGDALMGEAIASCEREFGFGPIYLGAQAHLAGWYGRLGFAVCGPGYEEDGIPHLPMRRARSGTPGS